MPISEVHVKVVPLKFVFLWVGGWFVSSFGLLFLFRAFFLAVSRNSLQHFLSSLLQQRSRAAVSKERQSSL